MSASVMWSTPPAEPPPTATFPASLLSASRKSFTVLNGELGATAIALYSIVSRASGVVWSRLTGVLLVRMPPTMITPVTMNALSFPFMVLTNSARPMVPAAPPLLVTWAPAVWMPSACSAASTARPVASQPPPGLAGTMTLSGSAAEPASGSSQGEREAEQQRAFHRQGPLSVDMAPSFYPAGSAQNRPPRPESTGTVPPGSAGLRSPTASASSSLRRPARSRKRVRSSGASSPPASRSSLAT